MRIILMATGSFALPCLDYLSREEGIVLAAAVTKPNRPAGRERLLHPTPVKESALAKGLNVLEPVDFKAEGFYMDLKKLNPDLFVVISFGKILPKKMLELPEFGAINIHASLLPAYRGASPINWAVINGDKETGVTSFFMEEGLDTGPIISQRSCPIGPGEDSGALEDKLKTLAIEVLAETLNKVKEGEAGIKQDGRKATLAPKITFETGRIDWSWGGERIGNLIRGLSPRPGAYSFFKRPCFSSQAQASAILVKLWKAVYLKDMAAVKDLGRVIETGPEGIKVCAGEGGVLIKELQPAGKRRMSAEEFWRGYG